MKNSSAFILGVIFGGTVGIAASCKFIKGKYEAIADEEIESVRKFYKEKADRYEESFTPEEHTEYHKYVEEYAKENDIEGGIAEAVSHFDADNVDRPYVISPDSFGEIYDYARISLTYYADGILADDEDEIVDDVDAIIGLNSLTHFGEYEDDSVFVRNDALKCDYEILLDNRKYSEVLMLKPPSE